MVRGRCDYVAHRHPIELASLAEPGGSSIGRGLAMRVSAFVCPRGVGAGEQIVSTSNSAEPCTRRRHKIKGSLTLVSPEWLRLTRDAIEGQGSARSRRSL
jgi:hypothetical protein